VSHRSSWLWVDGLTGQRINPDLGHKDGHILQLTVQTQDLSAFGGVLHHLTTPAINHQLTNQATAELCFTSASGGRKNYSPMHRHSLFNDMN